MVNRISCWEPTGFGWPRRPGRVSLALGRSERQSAGASDSAAVSPATSERTNGSTSVTSPMV